MDIWKFYDVTHRYHEVCNPTSRAKLDELVGLLRLNAGSAVLDIACGLPPKKESSFMLDSKLRKGAIDGQEILHTGADY